MDNKEINIRSSVAEFIVFSAQAGEDTINVRYEDETLWMTQKMMSLLFDIELA